jgi:protein-disulfide isomerase/uncharacterized membrane protein
MLRDQKTFSYNIYFSSLLLITISGIIISAYLVNTHYRNYTDLTYSSFCAISKTINCDTVAQSPWSIAFGLPVALWGFFSYILFLTILLPLYKRNQAALPLWSLLVLLGGIYSLVSLFLSYISAAKIHSYCLLCLLSYAINFALSYMSWIIRKRFNPNPFLTDLHLSISYIAKSKKFCIVIGILLILCILPKIFLPKYWKLEPPPISTNVSHGLTESGHPWIGAKQPSLTIEEFTDYQCFQCAKTHLMLRHLVEEHPATIRLVHHHYPMDHEFNPIVVPEPFHVGSGKMAMIGIYAASKNKFWEMNDVLYAIGREKQPFNTKTLAKMTGFPAGELAAAIRSPQIKEALLHDIRKGMKLRITGTPTFVINDKVYQGAIPADILKAIIQ